MKPGAHTMKRRAARSAMVASRTGMRRQARTLRAAGCLRKVSGALQPTIGEMSATAQAHSKIAFSARQSTHSPTETKQADQLGICFCDHPALNQEKSHHTVPDINCGFQHNTRYSDVFSLIAVLEEKNYPSCMDRACNNTTDCDFLGSLLKYTHIL